MNGNDCLTIRNYNGQHRKHDRLSLDKIETRSTVEQSTSTSDLHKKLRDQSTSTEDLLINNHDDEEVKECDHDIESRKNEVNCDEINDENGRLQQQRRRELFKAKSSPSIMQGIKLFSQILYYFTKKRM